MSGCNSMDAAFAAVARVRVAAPSGDHPGAATNARSPNSSSTRSLQAIGFGGPPVLAGSIGLLARTSRICSIQTTL